MLKVQITSVIEKTHAIVINDQPLEKVQSYKYLQVFVGLYFQKKCEPPWGFTFLLTYPGATTFLIYAQELKSKWACCIVTSIVTVSLTH